MELVLYTETFSGASLGAIKETKTAVFILETFKTSRQISKAGLNTLQYRKILITIPGLTFVLKAVLVGLFSEELIIGRNFAFQNGEELIVKTEIRANPNCP